MKKSSGPLIFFLVVLILGIILILFISNIGPSVRLSAPAAKQKPIATDASHMQVPGSVTAPQGSIEGSLSVSDLSECSDGIDNDCNGFIDYPNDWGCSSPQDNSESNGFIWGYGYGGPRDSPRTLEQVSSDVNTLFILSQHIAPGAPGESRFPFRTIETGLAQDKKFIFDASRYSVWCINNWHDPTYWSDPLTECISPNIERLINDLADEENRNPGFIDHLFGIYIVDEAYLKNCFATDPPDGERFNRTTQEFVIGQIKTKFQERFNRPIKTIINYAVETGDLEGIEEDCVRNNAFVNLDGSGGIPENLDIIMFDYYPFNTGNEGKSYSEYQEFIDGRINILEQTAPGKPIFLWGESYVGVDANGNILSGRRFPNDMEMNYYLNTIKAHPQVRGMLWFMFDASGEICPLENCTGLYTPLQDYLNYLNKSWATIGPGHKESSTGEFFDAGMVNRIKQLGINLQKKCGLFNVIQNDKIVARFSECGKVLLNGQCSIQFSCAAAPTSSFKIKNINNEVVAYIDNLGNLCVQGGSCSQASPNCNVANTAFSIKNSEEKKTITIDQNGALCFVGGLKQQRL
jgi:hypothetical protein